MYRNLKNNIITKKHLSIWKEEILSDESTDCSILDGQWEEYRELGRVLVLLTGNGFFFKVPVPFTGGREFKTLDLKTRFPNHV